MPGPELYTAGQRHQKGFWVIRQKRPQHNFRIWPKIGGCRSVITKKAGPILP